MARVNLPRVRRICLSFPEAVEIEAWGSPTFRIGKIFAMYAQPDHHHGDGREGIWIKTNHFTQDLLVRGQPARYFSPPYVGPGGWTGAYLDAETDWIAVTELLRDAYRATAPKRLAVLLGDDAVVKKVLKKVVKKVVKKGVKGVKKAVPKAAKKRA